MRKVERHGKPNSPFGSTVSQIPDKPDETVEIRDPEEVEEAPAEETSTDLITKPEASTDVPSTSVGLKLPTIEDFMPESTVKLLTAEQRKALQGSVRNLGYWMEAAMICEDHQCAFKEKCHLFRAKIPRPKGEDCPIELAQMHSYKVMLMSKLSEDDRSDPFLEIQINDLVHIMMQEARAHGQFGIDGGVIEVDDVRGIVPATGEHVISKVVHRAIGILERLGKRKERLLAKLLATPLDRAKADRDGVYDRSRKAAQIGDRIAKIAEQRKKEMKKETYIVEMEGDDAKVTEVIDVPTED